MAGSYLMERVAYKLEEGAHRVCINERPRLDTADLPPLVDPRQALPEPDRDHPPGGGR